MIAYRAIRASVTILAVLLASGLGDPASAMRRREADAAEVARPMGEPLMAIVALGSQRVTIYDADGWILRAPVSSGQPGYETPAGIYSVLQKEADHVSNLYEDASMPFMQRITWSGIALHAGPLPGHPASHGCIRLPYEFAEKLFGMTKLGMRVIVARHDIQPTEIEHPALFRPAVSPRTSRSIAAARAAEVQAMARKANAARAAAARLSAEASRLVPTAESMKRRAEAHLAAAESALAGAISPAATLFAEQARARALDRLAEAEAQLVTAKTEAPLKAEAAAQARDEALAAEAARIAAVEATREATRAAAPVSIFVSRKTERLYVRQSFQQILESPVTIRDAAEPIGTHLYTARDTTDGGNDLRWSVVSLRKTADRHGQPRRADRLTADPPAADPDSPSAALDRIEIPREIADRLSELVSPGSSLIVSDEGMSAETGKDTDFVVLMSGEPQGAIKTRRPTSQARARENVRAERTYRRPRDYPAPVSWDPFVPW